MYEDLRDKVVLLTGIGQMGDLSMWGNGAAIAKVLACENGAKVFGCDLHIDAAEHTTKRIEAEGGVCSVVTCDVTDAAQVKKLVAMCIEKYGTIILLLISLLSLAEHTLPIMYNYLTILIGRIDILVNK